MISNFFIDRPIVAMVIAIVTVIAGLIAMRGLPLAQFPQIVPPQIITSTSYTGADAVTAACAPVLEFTAVMKRRADSSLLRTFPEMMSDARTSGFP